MNYVPSLSKQSPTACFHTCSLCHNWFSPLCPISLYVRKLASRPRLLLLPHHWRTKENGGRAYVRQAAACPLHPFPRCWRARPVHRYALRLFAHSRGEAGRVGFSLLSAHPFLFFQPSPLPPSQCSLTSKPWRHLGTGSPCC